MTKTRRHCVTHSLQEGGGKEGASGTFTFTTRVFYQILSAASLEGSCDCSEKNGTFPAIKNII